MKKITLIFILGLVFNVTNSLGQDIFLSNHILICERESDVCTGRKVKSSLEFDKKNLTIEWKSFVKDNKIVKFNFKIFKIDSQSVKNTTVFYTNDEQDNIVIVSVENDTGKINVLMDKFFIFTILSKDEQYKWGQ